MSPVATHDDEQAVAALERATDELFYERGVVGVSVADVRDASGVSLRRIYSLCPSKADLVALWLRTRHRTWTAALAADVDKHLAAGRSPVDAIFDSVAAWMTVTDFRGCGFLNTHAEASELTDEHLDIIQTHKRSVAAYLDTVTGHGDAMAVLVDGAIVQAAMFRNVEPIEQARFVATTFTARGARS